MKYLYPITEWQSLFHNSDTSGIFDSLRRCYGNDDTRITDRLNMFSTLLEGGHADSAFVPSGEVVIGRTPCRVRVFGGHTDFRGCGGCLINMAGNLEMMFLGQLRNDRTVVLRNLNDRFRGFEFELDDWDVKPDRPIETEEEWDGWCADVEKKKKGDLKELLHRTKGSVTDREFDGEWRNYRERNWQEFVKGIIAYLQTDLGDKKGRIRKKLRGFNAMFSSEIPMGWGLSSSSSLVMSTAQIINTLLDLNLSDEQIIELGYCEHYNGTKGGMNDHAAIIKGIKRKILLMRSFPEEIVETAPFPQGISVFLADSGIKRSQAPAVSKKFLREGINDSAEILSRTGIGYAVASLWIKHHFPEYIDAMHSGLGNTANPYGLIREFNRGGNIPFRTEERRIQEISRILRTLPQQITRTQLIAGMPEYKPELEQLFTSHGEPAGGYRLRGMALYGLAENERSIEYLERANRGDFAGMQQLMRISQDGDRIVKHTFSAERQPTETPFDSDVRDEDLKQWADNPKDNPVWLSPGYFERSIEKIDLMCDLIEEHFGEVATARVSAAGLGGSVTILAKSENVSEIRDFLSRLGYESIPPLTPCTGASVLGV